MIDSSTLAGLATYLPAPVTVIDVGCRWGPAEPWKDLPNVRLFGFDADAAECEKLNQAASDKPLTRFFPIALGASAGLARLHLAAEPACSSLYPPDPELIEERPGLALISQVGLEEVRLDTLDAWSEREGVGAVDLLKIDTQGSELDVLRGAERTLGSVRAVEVEVEFNPIYLGQPLFGEVDAFLRERGFILWRMSDLTHYGLPNDSSAFQTTEAHWFDHPEPATFHGRGGQLFWANAFYVRREIAFGQQAGGWQDCLRDAVVAAGLGFWDLSGRAAARCIQEAPPEVVSQLQKFLAAPAGGDSKASGNAEQAGAPAAEPVAEPPDPRTVLRPYEIGEYAVEVGARLGEVLSARPSVARSGSVRRAPEADLKPALPDRPVNPASVGSRRVAKRVQLDSGESFEILLDPELDDWKTAAYLADEGHLVDAALVELVLKLTAPGDVVFDLGAFLGGISLPAAAAGCNVVAVEPWNHAAALLRSSATANRFNNLKVLRAAVTEEAGMADYFAAGLHGRIAAKGDVPVVAVPTIRVDDLVAELGGPQVRLVRIDVEGAEPRVLEGMEGLLDAENPPAVLFEADEVALRRFGSTARRLFGRFDELGYTLYEVGDRTLTLLRPADRPIPAVVECLAVRSLPPATSGWKLIGGSRP